MKIRKNTDRNNEKYREYLMKKAALIKIAIFFGLLMIGAAVSMVIPIRPSFSVNEKRELSKYPEFNPKDFLSGEYFKQVDTWFSDTFPGRDSLMMCSEKITELYGIRTNVIHGEIVVGDEIPDVEFNEDEYNIIVDINIPPNSQPDFQMPTVENYEFDNAIKVDAADIGNTIETTDTGVDVKEGESLGSIFVVGDSAYNYYSFSQEISDKYVNMTNNLANILNGDAVLYSLIIPTAIDIQLDDATRNSISSSDQKKAIQYMYSKMGKNVGKCYIFDLFRTHREENLYFRTDHHWTARGAYYAYYAFVSQLKKAPAAFESFTEEDYGDFVGSYYTQTRVSSLRDNPDTIYAYIPASTNALEMINKDGDYIDYSIITDVSGWNMTSKYSTFIGGDNPYTYINNPNISDGSSCLIIKESFGNALVPFLVESFQDVYVIDYRYYKDKTVSELVKEKGIQNVLIVNNIAVTSTKARVEEMEELCK